jgi:hypothetical protein
MKVVDPLQMRPVVRRLLTSCTALLLLACKGVDGVEDSSAGNVPVLEFARVPDIESFHEDLTLQVVSCGSFDVIRHVVDDVTMQTFFDAQGAPVRVAIHVVEQNTLTNSATGTYVQYPGILNLTIDLASGVTRATGTPIHITQPHEGNVLFDAGIVVVDQDGNTIFQGGPHAFGPNGDPSVFCALLS